MADATGVGAFREARDLLLTHRCDHATAYREFTWPELGEFNWALDWFDGLARDNHRTALCIAQEDGSQESYGFAALSERSAQVANWLAAQGVGPGDPVVVMLGNQVELWETMLAAMKLRAVVIPATTLLGPADLADRIERGRARHVIATSQVAPQLTGATGGCTRVAVGEPVPGWLDYRASHDSSTTFEPTGPTWSGDPLLRYFTSGTTAQPKLVEHTHASYPVGHLSTMFWIGLEPGDVHLNISSPGWAKHAYSSLFAPWNAEATVFVVNYARFDAERLLEHMERGGVTSICAPPTVWRMMIQADLGRLATPPKKAVAAGEPLNPEVIEQVRRAWGVTVRDGYGQTETTLQVANPPGRPFTPGTMGVPCPGYRVVLLDPVTGEPADEGEICLDLAHRPMGLMTGYHGDPERNAEAMAGGYYHTGDIASRGEDGALTYIGRADDVFKASDYKISPFELESVLLTHPAVAEAAVVPSPDPLRLAVPKAFVALAEGWEPTAETARAVFAHSRQHLAPYQRIRRLEFQELPKTISGKIRRAELRAREADRPDTPATEYREDGR
ncbi:AMP-dependent synthetase [Wenjunlia vitaminophila]|uniref:AMP-dependent synthetase n=1 Tax=Wenjunlia vitaminophila TaxID=76728 RepID=A0A0T6LZ82_WENVI|nr:AMP-binding protein [Wenjunlia vitaminophila]KRV51317.1 AMP-dependent synthetase [Wenjunlia vitaminophila]